MSLNDDIRNQPRGTFFAIALIVAGVILFADNVGILPIDNIGGLWPLALSVYGLGLLIRRLTPNSVTWAATLILFGILLTLGNMGVIHATFAIAWPMLLIAFGITALINRAYWVNRPWARGDWARNWTPYQAEAWMDKRQWRQWRRERRMRRWQRFADSGPGEPGIPGSWIHEDAVFFNIKRRMEGREISGGELVAVFGSIELDLRDAAVAIRKPKPGETQDVFTAVRRAELEATAVFGSVEIRVPQNWRVVKEGTGVFGSYEDKTLPVRPEPGVEPPVLVIHGGAVFGSVTIESC